VIRQGHLIAVVGVFLIGCAVLLLVVGCTGVRSEAPKEQAQSDRCERTRSIYLGPSASASTPAALFITNDVPGCPNKGGLLSAPISGTAPMRHVPTGW
jgi:hypothetical protein